MGSTKEGILFGSGIITSKFGGYFSNWYFL